MSWQVALQTITTGLAGIGIYFLWELVREYKVFKTQTAENLFSIRVERKNFEVAIISAGVKLDQLKQTTDHSLSIINLELKNFRDSMEKLKSAAEKSEELLNKNISLNKELQTGFVLHEKEIKHIKVRLGEVTIFKSGKKF